MNGIPLIDISALFGANEPQRQATEAQFAGACRDIGFAIVIGHGIPPGVMQRVRKLVIEYFARPLETKMTDVISKDNYRGYIPLGFFTPNAAGAADAYEGYKLHRETSAQDPICSACTLYGPNKWPSRQIREAVLDYWRHCDRVAGALLEALALSLGVDPGILRAAFDEPLTNMTLLHYPPQASGEGGFGIHPHKDTDALTILAPDPVGGLQVRGRGQSDWIDARAPDNALIVNIGDLLEVWSGGRYVSTPHRVINNNGSDRYSFPYFAVPRFDVCVAPLLPPAESVRRREIHVGDASRAIWYSNWPDAAPIDPCYDPAVP